MKRVFLSLLVLAIGLSAMAQQKIQLRSADKAECVKSDMTSLNASFSFSTITAEDYNSERGTFSWLSMANTVIGGNEGDPQIPVVNELIAVPFGAQPRIEITSYSTTDYRLEDLGIHTLVPRQLPVRKSQRPEDVPFIMNEAAYQTRGLRSEPQAVVNVEGIMRGVQLGKMTIEPVSYDPVNNTLRVFNDIEVTVHFDGADRLATEEMLVKTYSPYFDIAYKSLFNGRAITSIYDQHPDLYSTPVKMLVVTTSTYQNSTAYQNWLTWKKQKGIHVDEYIVTSSTSSSTIRSQIQSRYNSNHPTFLVIVGDETVVKNYDTYNFGSTAYPGAMVSDLKYASIDNDVYHDMYMSRMAVSSTTELNNLVNKILTYEKYTMSDPSYLNKVLLIAGNDTSSGNWDEAVGRPTIQYAVNNYYNAAHGFTNVYKYNTSSNYSGCYNYLSSGVGFLNYTAHGDINALSDPSFTVNNVSSLTNNDKYFWLVANCCLTANWGNSSVSPCLGEAMIRASNKGAFGYIGSVPETLWYEDYYFGVGAFPYVAGTVQTTSSTSTGMYDALFDDTGFNTLNSVPFIGNLAVSYAHAQGYTSSVNDEYYWRAYQCLGDGSVMPYLVNPAANNVSHDNSIPAGVSSFRVYADVRSYVSITVNNEIIGVAAVPANATYVDVPFTTAPVAGQTAMIVVTRNQRQPYINANVPVASNTQYSITANVSPANGGTVTGAGQYYGNSNCTLTATANHGYVFNNWTLNNTVVSTDPTYTFTVTGNATYTANFIALQAHAITCNPVEHGTISASATTAYVGDLITLTATPQANYHLDQWIVRDATGNSIIVSNDQFTMPDSDVTVGAIFRSGYTVTVFDAANGTITASATTAQPGTVINLTVTPNSGYTFMDWNVYQSGEPGNAVTVTNNRFTMPEFDVTVNAVFGAPGEVQVEVEETVSVGGTSTTTNTYFPTTNTTRYSLTEQIYTAAELGEAGTITGIEFYQTGTSRSRTLEIYMVSTTKSSFDSRSDWITPSSSNIVYSGSVTFAKGAWTTITFSTPFVYDGTSNVALIVDDNTNSSNTSGMTFYVYNGSSNSAIRISGTTNYDPTSISSNGTLAATKNRANFHITRLQTQTQILPVTCEAPIMAVYDATPYSADVYWAGESESYNIRYRIPSGFIYDFESAEPFAVDAFAPCTTFDGDGCTTWGVDGASFTNSGYTGSFIAFPYGTIGGFTPHGGVMFGLCMDAHTDCAPNNDFFILPALTIESGDVFTFWARSANDNYGLEQFKVGVYGGNGTLSSYLAGSATASVSAPTTWTEYSYDLSAYAGQTIQLAINCVSNDVFGFFIDDIFVGQNNAPWIETIIDVSTYPYTIEGLTPETLYEAQVQGVCSGIGETEWVGSSFTTTPVCSAPIHLTAEASATSANLEWTGFVDSYNLQYRTAGYTSSGFFDDFENGSLNNWDWTTYTQGDAFSGFGWFDYNPQSLTTSFPTAYSGSNCAISLSYGNAALHANNYLVTPQVSLDGTLKFWVMSNYADEYEVLLSTGGNAVSDFTVTLQAMSAAPSSWTEVSIDLSRYAGQQGYIAIHHVFYDGWGLFVDDFGIFGEDVPAGEWHTVNNVTSPYALTGLSPDTYYEWQVQGDCTDWSASSIFLTHSLCDAPVGLTTTDITANSATLNWAEDLDKYNVHYAPVAFYEDFENGLDNWTTVRNGAGTENTDWHIINSATAFSNGAIPAHSGTYVVMSRSYSGEAYSVDNWLISPQLTLDGYLRFWVMDDGEYHEHFDVYVSTTGKNISDFSLLAQPGDASSEWTEVTVDLRSYQGAQGYIAIRNIDNDKDFLFVDDFAIYATDWTAINRVNTGLVVNNLESVTDYAWQVQGVNCDGSNGTTEWSSIAMFTTAFGLTAGCNWWTPTTAMTLEQLKEALGSNAVLINSQDAGFARYEGGQWSGTLTRIVPGQMYKIEATTPVSLTLSGAPAMGVSLTLMPGYNWFGYTGTQAKDITTALVGFTPTNGDTITAQDGTTITYSNGRWSGAFTLTPGHGYVYYSKATQSSALSF